MFSPKNTRVHPKVCYFRSGLHIAVVGRRLGCFELHVAWWLHVLLPSCLLDRLLHLPTRPRCSHLHLHQKVLHCASHHLSRGVRLGNLFQCWILRWAPSTQPQSPWCVSRVPSLCPHCLAHPLPLNKPKPNQNQNQNQTLESESMGSVFALQSQCVAPVVHTTKKSICHDSSSICF
jgi:hypothetical protein